MKDHQSLRGWQHRASVRNGWCLERTPVGALLYGDRRQCIRTAGHEGAHTCCAQGSQGGLYSWGATVATVAPLGISWGA